MTSRRRACSGETTKPKHEPQRELEGGSHPPTQQLTPRRTQGCTGTGCPLCPAASDPLGMTCAATRARTAAWSDVVGSCGANGMWESRLSSPVKRRDSHTRNREFQVRDLGIHWWRYLPLTRTRRKALTCRFARRWNSTGLHPPQSRAPGARGACAIVSPRATSPTSSPPTATHP